MKLADHQRAMLRLIRFGVDDSALEDPYVRTVAASRDLQEARHNVFLWRSYVLSRTAPLTFNLLKHRGLLKAEMEEYIAQHNLSPFRETHAPVFLDQVSHHPDPTIARVAQFENALRLARNGDSRTRTMTWNGNPIPLLARLAKDEPLDTVDGDEGSYEVIVSRDLPGYFDVRIANGEQSRQCH